MGSSIPDYTTYNHTTFAVTGGTDSVYKKIADVNLKSFLAGDSVLFKMGGTWTNERLIFTSSGTVLNPITIGAYGSGTNPTFNGTSNTSGGGNGISVFGKSNVIVQDFIIYNYAQGVATGGNTNVTIQRMTIHDSYYSGVAFSWAGNTSTVKDSEIYNITYNGIALDGSGANNTGNTFSNLNIHNNYSGIKVQFSTGNSFTNISSYNNSSSSVGISNIDGSHNNTFTQILVYGQSSGIEVVDSNNVVINYSISRNNTSTGISFKGTSSGGKAQNSVLFSNGDGLYLAGTASSIQATNVIAANNTNYGLNSSNLGLTVKTSISYNNTSGAFNGTYTDGGGNLTSDPVFVNSGTYDFHLQRTSPAINAGTDVSLTSDYVGTSVPQGSVQDMGAYEFILPSAPSSLAQYKSDGITSIATGSWTNESTVTINVGMSSPNSSDSLTPQIEMREIGTTFSNVATNVGIAVSYSGTSITGIVTVTGLTSGKTYHWQARVSNAAGQSSWVAMGGNPDFKVDTTAPSGGSITYTDGYYTTASVLLTVADGTDSVSDVNISTRIVQRKSATLTNGSCGTYGSWGTITPTGSYSSYTDTTVSSSTCYQYQYLVSDNAGNQATYTSSNTAYVLALPSSPSSLAQYQSDGTSSISSSGTLGTASTVVLKFSMSSTNSSDTLTPQVEVQHQGTAFTNTPTNTGSAVNFTGTAVTGTVTIPSMGSGSFHWQARVSNSAGQSSWVSMGGNPDFYIEFSPASNNSSAPSCGDQAPGTKAPWLYGAIAQGSNSVLLYFTSADDPVDKYVLEYGTKSGDYPYGSTNIGGKDTRTYLVKSLSPNTIYYFRVRAGNGCATGAWSNEISAETLSLVSINQLEIISSELKTVPSEEKQAETVKTETVSPSSTPTPFPTGYDVKVKVIDTNKNPVEGAKVTIHSNIQESITNKDGLAEFKNVEPGEHRVIIAYRNYEGEQTVNLTGNVKEFDLNVTIQQKAISLSPLAYGIIGFLVLIIVILGIVLIRSKRQ